MQAADDLTKPVRLGPLSVAKVMRALLDGPCSVLELQQVSGLSTSTLHAYMRALRKERVVHISGWEKDATGRDSLRVFQLGAGRDAARKRKPKALVARECRQRKQEARMLQRVAGVLPQAANHAQMLLAPLHRRAL
ncbi:MAG: helix-turn-helix domain-containing protein [Rhodoferax sp.]